MKECRIIIIHEESGELLKNDLIDEELADQISGILEDGYIENYEGCETICSNVSKMLEDAGIKAEGHEEMIDALEDLKLIRKEVNPKYIEKLEKIKKTKGKIIRKKRKSKKKKIEYCGCE